MKTCKGLDGLEKMFSKGVRRDRLLVESRK